MTYTLSPRVVSRTVRAVRIVLPGTHQDRAVRVLLVVSFWLAAILAIGLLMQIIGETGGRNSYALLAEAFLSGRLNVSGCFDTDCAMVDGLTYIVFPPAPALVAAPFVLVFGASFDAFILLSAAMAAAALSLWWRIFAAMKVEPATALWLMLALAFGTPLYYVVIRGDGIWFFAQICAFLAVTAAIWAAVERRSLLFAGACIAFAFLSRQMALFVLPFIYVLWLRPDEPLLSFRADRIRAVLNLIAPVVVALFVYLALNEARFGNPLDTGYAYIGVAPEARTFINDRIDDIGLFSADYVVFNLVYLLVQGFHADFAGTHLTELAGLDSLGTSLLAASPFVLLAVFAPLSRSVGIGALCALAMIVPMLFYHSNGFTQFNVQRYVLDWLPILFCALALAVGAALRPALAVLVTYAIVLNVVTAAIAWLTHA